MFSLLSITRLIDAVPTILVDLLIFGRCTSRCQFQALGAGQASNTMIRFCQEEYLGADKIWTLFTYSYTISEIYSFGL